MLDIVKKDPFYNSFLGESFFRDFFNMGMTQPGAVDGSLRAGQEYSLELPGVKKEDINVELDGTLVRVSWTRGESKGQAVYLVPSVTEDIKATLDLGVLTLKVVAPEKSSQKRAIKIE